MILDQPGQTFFYEDNRPPLTVGAEIVANGLSGYAGLTGVVSEIRDGADKETENPSTDVYCDFRLPESDLFRMELEKRFSKEAGKIPLEQVIMAPDMLEPKMFYQIVPQPMYVLTYFIDCDTDTDSDTDTYVLAVSNDKDHLQKLLKAHKTDNLYLNGKLSQFEVHESHEDGYSFVAESDDVYICYSVFEVVFEAAAKGGKNDAA